MPDPNKKKKHRFESAEKSSSAMKYLFLGAVFCCVIAVAVCFLSAGSQNKENSAALSRETLEPTVGTLPAETIAPVESTTETQNEPEIFQHGNEEPLVYETAQLDNGDRTLNKNNHHNALVYCYYPVFSGSEAADVINADVTRVAEAFANTYTRAEIQEMHYAYGMPYAFSHTGFIDPTYNGPGILSVLLSYGSFWGEDNIYEGGYAGYVYSLTTGEQLTLTKLTGLPEDQLLGILQNETKRILKERYAKWEITDRSLVQLDSLTLDDFGFYIAEDKKIHATINGIHMRQEDPARGYWVSIKFPIGFSIH